MIRPLKLLRIMILFPTLSYILLIALWAFLPSPTEDNGRPDYATSILRSGKTLTRVYDTEDQPHPTTPWLSGFALTYTLTPTTLSVCGVSVPLHIPLLSPTTEEDMEIPIPMGDSIRGANLPWFPFADATLLYWEIYQDTVVAPFTVVWEADGDEGSKRLRRLQVGIEGWWSPLITLDFGNDGEDVVVTVPGEGRSFAPSRTYPLRVAVIRVLAPSAMFLNGIFGPFARAIGSGVGVVVAVIVYGFLIGAVVVSLWRVLGGRSVSGMMKRWKGDERVRRLRLQEGVEWVEGDRRFRAFVRICREGWHPERESERVKVMEEAEKDEEKG